MAKDLSLAEFHYYRVAQSSGVAIAGQIWKRKLVKPIETPYHHIDTSALSASS